MCEFFLCPSASEARRANVCTEAVCLLHDEHRPGATRPTLAGRERRVYALVASLPYSGAQTAFFSLDLTLESFLEGHVRAFEWLGGAPRVRLRQSPLGRRPSRRR